MKKLPPGESAATGAAQLGSGGAVRFTLRELMIAVTVIAALLALLTQIGIFGALAAFIGTALFSCVIYPKLNPNDRRAQALMFDFLWGVGMPIICFVFDPLVFKDTIRPDNPTALDALFDPAGTIQGARVNAYGLFVYPFATWQMAMLTIWLLIAPQAGRWSGLFSGTFVLGAGVAWLIGLVLVIPSLLGTMFLGIGLLGLTPLVTAFVYSRHFLRANSVNRESETALFPAVLTLIGIIAAVALPALMDLILLAAFQGTDAVLKLFVRVP